MQPYNHFMLKTCEKYIAMFLIVFGGCMLLGRTEAAVIVKEFRAPLEVMLQGEQAWKPFTSGTPLNSGDQVLTGKGGFVDLICEDGSTIHLNEETQLAISQLEYSEPQKTRLTKLKLLMGTVTAKATPLTFDKNEFSVETDTVVAGFKFSSMTITLKDGGTTIIPLEGHLTFQQTQGGTQIVHTSTDGVKTTYALPQDAQVAMKITEGQPVQIESTVTIPDMTITATDIQGDSVTATVTLPPNTQFGIQHGQTAGTLLSLTGNVEITDLQVSGASQTGNMVNVTLRTPDTQEQNWQVDIGITAEGELVVSTNADLTMTLPIGSGTATATIPAGATVTVDQDPTTGEVTIGGTAQIPVQVGTHTVVIGAGGEVKLTPTTDNTSVTVTVTEGSATVDGRAINQGGSTTIEAPTGPAPATETTETPVEPPAPPATPGENIGSPVLP